MYHLVSDEVNLGRSWRTRYWLCNCYWHGIAVWYRANYMALRLW